MAVSVDTYGVVTGTTGVSQAFTLNASANVLCIGVIYMNDENQGNIAGNASATWNSAGMTNRGRVLSNVDTYVQIFSLDNPATGTRTLNVTFDTPSVFNIVGWTSFIGADGSPKVSGFTSASGAGSSPPSITVSSISGGMVFDTVFARANALSVGTGQTQRFNTSITANGAAQYGAGSTEAGASSVVMDWSLAIFSSWAHAGVSINAAAAAPKRLTLLGCGLLPILRSISLPFSLRKPLDFNLARKFRRNASGLYLASM